MKRILITVLSLILICVLMAGCSSEVQNPKTEPKPNSTTAAQITPSETASQATVTNEPATETPGSTTETPVVSTETPVVSTETPVVSTETPVVSTETPVVSTETPIVSTETPVVSTETPAPGTITLTKDELYDKIVGGWIGQMVGVAWGAPTEFCWAGELIPESRVPAWKDTMINDAFNQDDLYVEIPFMDAMKKNGYDCSISLIAKGFKNSTFALWHANGMGRDNLRRGISAPESGSYLNNYHCDDIDWQIECDFLGMMYPGLVNEAAARAFELGHIMNYGDGVYGGVFVTAMHAAAFTAASIDEICLAGMSVIPDGTDFKTLITEVYENYKAGDTFEQNWRKLQDKWGGVDICPELRGVSNIDAKLNSGYILLGLLYGEGDMDKTIILSMRCGQDSDCNPSSAASILGNYYGAEKLPESYKSKLYRDTTKFATTKYNFNETIDLNYELMEQVLLGNGAEKDENGDFTLSYCAAPVPVPFEQVPDGVYVYTYTGVTKNNLRFYEVTPFYKNENVTGYEIDVGDGTVYYSVTPYQHSYEKAGEYTVKFTVYGDKGSVFTKEITAKIKKDAEGPLTGPTFICTITNPTGGGSKDISVIGDGYVPKTGDGDSKQYDTYILGDPHGNPDKTIYIGYLYKEGIEVTSVSFTEGNHFGNGGWFKNGQIGIEVLVNGEWIKVDTTLDTPYPVGDDKAVFGKPYETYVFTLNTPVTCDGVRLIGLGGGSASFISVGELTVQTAVGE